MKRAVLIMLLFLCACSTDTTSGGEQIDAQPSQEVQIPTSTPEPTNTPAPTETPTPPPTKPAIGIEDVSAGLLSIEDFPPGWTDISKTEDEDRGTGDTFNFICKEIPRRAVEEKRADFQASSFGPFLYETIRIFPPGEAQLAFSEMSQTLQECKTWIPSGGSIEFSIEEIPYTSIGDETTAAHAISSMGVNVTEAESVYILYDNIVLEILQIYLGAGEIDSQFTLDMALMAFEKMQGPDSQ